MKQRIWTYATIVLFASLQFATPAVGTEAIAAVTYGLKRVALYSEPGGVEIGQAEPQALFQLAVIGRRSGFLRLGGLKREVWVREIDVIVDDAVKRRGVAGSSDVGTSTTQGVHWN